MRRKFLLLQFLVECVHFFFWNSKIEARLIKRIYKWSNFINFRRLNLLQRNTIHYRRSMRWLRICLGPMRRQRTCLGLGPMRWLKEQVRMPNITSNIFKIFNHTHVRNLLWRIYTIGYPILSQRFHDQHFSPASYLLITMEIFQDIKISLFNLVSNSYRIEVLRTPKTEHFVNFSIFFLLSFLCLFPKDFHPLLNLFFFLLFSKTLCPPDIFKPFLLQGKFCIDFSLYPLLLKKFLLCRIYFRRNDILTIVSHLDHSSYSIKVVYLRLYLFFREKVVFYSPVVFQAN